MIPDQVQSTVFVVDIVDIQPGEAVGPVNNGVQRLRIREITTVLNTGCLTGTGGTCDVDSRTEVELDYEVVRDAPPGHVTISDHAIKFNNAGLKIYSRGVGLEDRELPCSLVPNMTAQMMITLFDTLNEINNEDIDARNNVLVPLPPDPDSDSEPGADSEPDPNAEINYGPNVVAALWECFVEDFGGEESLKSRLDPAKNRAITAPNTRVFDFHVHARFDSTGGTQINNAQDLPGTAKALVSLATSRMTNNQAENLRDGGRLQPLIWFPFADNEAFAVGAVTTTTTLRMFGRLGAKTDGWRMTGSSHWMFSDNETRVLTFREDLTPNSLIPSERHAEFDAGALFPGDVDTKLTTKAINLIRGPVVFYIGAMPMEQPSNLSVATAQNGHPMLTSGTVNPIRFSYLNGELDAPIVFDPITNCGGCAT